MNKMLPGLKGESKESHVYRQFDLWFLWLFKIQLLYLEVLDSSVLKPSLKDFKHNLLACKMSAIVC